MPIHVAITCKGLRIPVSPPGCKMAGTTLCRVQGTSYQPVPYLRSWALHSVTSSCITDFDCGRMYGWVAYLGRDAAGYEGVETVAFRKREK